jgi:hypothetical protein
MNAYSSEQMLPLITKEFAEYQCLFSGAPHPLHFLQVVYAECACVCVCACARVYTHVT